MPAVEAALWSGPLGVTNYVRFRMMPDGPFAVNIYQFPEAAEVIAVLELGLNRAIAGEITAKDSLNDMATEIAAIMRNNGYESEALPPLE